MYPSTIAQNYLAFPLLMHYVTHGCPMDCGKTLDTQTHPCCSCPGKHPSAQMNDALAFIQAETLKKVKQDYSCLVPWDDSKDNPATNLKILLIMAIPLKVTPTAPS